MRRRNSNDTPKYSPQEILSAFVSPDSTRKHNFGPYRIEGDQLVYRAQSSKDAPPCDHNKFDAWRREVGVLIGDLDGKLVNSDGAVVMLESLTKDSPVGRCKIQYYDTNLIAQRTKSGKLIGNSCILPLVGRTVAYGNVSENWTLTDIQRHMMVHSDFTMLPLSKVIDQDLEQVEVLELGTRETVEVEELYGHTYKQTFTPSLFKIGDTHYLNYKDVSLSKGFKHVLVKLPVAVNTITEAVECLKPAQVVDAKDDAYQIGQWYFIPSQAPQLQALSTDERILILASHSYGLESSVLKYVSGGIAHRNDNSKVAKKLLKRVPASMSLDDETKVDVGIEIDGRFYCKIHSNSEKWYSPIRGLGVVIKCVAS